MTNTPTLHPQTLAVHGAAHLDAPVPGTPVSPPIVTSTSFYTAPSAGGFSATEMDEDAPHFYSRWSNPTVALLEQRVTALEGGAATVCFGSGMGAVAGLFLNRLGAGDHLVLQDVCYAGVAELARETLPRFGITVTTVDACDPQAVAAAIRPGQTKLVHVETPNNPLLRLVDIAAVAEIAHGAGAALSVDSTIATPVATQPLALGADFVIHSLSKYLCGHGDAIGGSVTGRDGAAMAAVRKEALIHVGAVLSPFPAWLILRGLESLGARMRVHAENAAQVAAFLEAHPRVTAVHWPGLDSHPQADLARRQMRTVTGLMSFTLRDGGAALADALPERLQVFSWAVSLGKAKSLLYYIGTDDILRTSFRLDAAGEAAYRARAGEGVFRVSVGLEHPADLIADLDQALA